MTPPVDPRLPDGLTAADLAELATQGSVIAEAAASGVVRYRLRWRVSGRQRGKYIGSDPVAANAVRVALAELQAPCKNAREFARLLRSARREARELKRLLAPALAGRGVRMHGYLVRHKRTGPGMLHPATLDPS